MSVTPEKAPWDARRRQRPAAPFAVPDNGPGSTPADRGPASWETHPLVWSNVLAADHHASKCQKAVTQVVDLEREHRREVS